MTLALVLLLFVFWELQWSNVQSQRAQAEVSDSLRDRWAAASTGDGSGDVAVAEARAAAGGIDAFAYMHIPAFGREWNRAVLAGTTQEALAAGPGHYTGSQAPGQRGNAAIAGHRDGHGAPFHDADKLGTCDAVVVETADKWLVYRVLPAEGQSGRDYVDAASACLEWDVAARLSDDVYNGLPGNHIISPDEVGVVAPVPNHPEISADEAELEMLTLTTCHPIWSNAQRMIVHSVLAETYDKSRYPADWKPAEAVA